MEGMNININLFKRGFLMKRSSYKPGKCRARVFHVEYLVLVLDGHQGSRVHKLLSDVSESPEASVVHRRVAVLVHKVHVSLVAEEQLDNLGEGV